MSDFANDLLHESSDRLRAALAAERKLVEEARAIISVARHAAESHRDQDECKGCRDLQAVAADWLARHKASRASNSPPAGAE
jgi:hypothetical protein